MASIDTLLTSEPPKDKTRRTRVLYISPLKALGVDVERNLRAPLTGIRHTADRLGASLPEVRVGVRSGDTSPADRRKLSSTPPDILITTPESLFLMLTSQARESLRGVETVILDEVHAVAGSKRGAHLALSLERLDALLEKPVQRIGLSATVRPLEEVAGFLGGSAPVEIVAPPAEKRWDLTVVVPVEDMTSPGRFDESHLDDDPDAGGRGAETNQNSIWPHVEESVVDLIEAHTSTIVFANSRRLAERLTARLNEIATSRAAARAGVSPEPVLVGGPPAQVMAQSGASEGAETVIAKAHHGSVSKEQRALIEDDLKRGRLPAVVATSSLELGIDMGAVDLVVQIESPPSVASALQRVGRAGHQVGEVSRGVLYPKHRGDLAQTAVAVERMRTGGIEAMRIPANPLDVLAQQVVAATALDEVDVEELYALVRRSAPFAHLPRSAYDATLDLLSGRYPSDEFAELRPRIVWDRVTGTLTGRPGAQRLAVTSGGTIPDRGLFGVFLVGGSEKGPGKRVGELDEEMVYESRVGDIFALGATSWRIEDITHDRVLVTPAPGIPGRLPFWKGDSLGRPAELGAAIGAFTRELGALPRAAAETRARDGGLDEWAAGNLVTYLHEQLEATQVLPSDTTILVERFRDELGDWRLVVHSPYGTPVHAPWALAINARLRERYGVDGQALASDDGIVIRIPDTDAEPPTGDLIVFDADELDQIVTTEVGGSALFAARFRECAARALLLPRRDPGRRSPLWQQRQRAAALLEVASKYPSFPIVLEAVRECLQDVYDLPALTALMRSIERREVQVTDVATTSPSPYARSLLFGYVAQFVYEGDSPIAERRAAALSLDQGLLAELLGRAELRELLDPDVLAEVEDELQRLAPRRKARSAEGIVDLVRLIGPLATDEVRERSNDDVEVEVALAELAAARRLVLVRVAGVERWAVVEDVGRLRDGLGVPVPPGTPEVFGEAVDDPLADLVARFARSHGPFTTDQVADRLGLGAAVARHTLQRLAAQGRVLDGEFRPAGSGDEWCDAEVLRELAATLVGPPAQGGRAGRAARARAVPRCLAARRRQAARRRRRGDRDRPVGRVPRPGLGPGAADPGIAGARLRALPPRRADRRRRGDLGRPRQPSRLRRLGQPAPGRPGPAHPARPGPAGGRGGAGRRPGCARAGWRLVLPTARRHRALVPGHALADRPGTERRAVGARLGGPGQQRHAHPAAGPHPVGLCQPPDAAPTTATRPRRPHRSSRDGGAMGDAARARHRPDPARQGRRRAPARPARRGDPWRRRQRAHPRWVRGGLQGALGLRGLRSLPARVLRRRSRRRAVRHLRGHRPAPHVLDVHRPRRRRPQARGARPGRHRPGQPLRSGAALAVVREWSPSGPQGRGRRRPRRRRPRALHRAWRTHPAHLVRDLER